DHGKRKGVPLQGRQRRASNPRLLPDLRQRRLRVQRHQAWTDLPARLDLGRSQSLLAADNRLGSSRARLGSGQRGRAGLRRASHWHVVTQTHYPQFCALARAAEIVGERWTLLIVRELLLGPKRFSDLVERLSGVSPTVLTGRLSALIES